MNVLYTVIFLAIAFVLGRHVQRLKGSQRAYRVRSTPMAGRNLATGPQGAGRGGVFVPDR
jgi:hypothetical protein